MPGTERVENADTIPVLVLAADDGYAMPLTVTLRSIQEHLSRTPRVRVYVLDCGIRVANRRRVHRSLDEGAVELEWVRIEPAWLRGLPTSGHIRASAYSRILIPGLLPDSHRRALYLDCDIIVRDDIAGLWEMDMAGSPLAAAQAGTMTLSSPGGLRLYRELGLPGNAKYLISGLLLMDLEQWRAERIQERIIAYLHENKQDVIYHDQDGINAILATRWVDVPAEWHVRVNCSKASDGPEGRAEAARMADESVKLLHFASSVKPWSYYADPELRGPFYEYLDKTEWRGWRPRPPVKAVLFNKYAWRAAAARLLRLRALPQPTRPGAAPGTADKAGGR